MRKALRGARQPTQHWIRGLALLWIVPGLTALPSCGETLDPPQVFDCLGNPVYPEGGLSNGEILVRAATPSVWVDESTLEHSWVLDIPEISGLTVQLQPVADGSGSWEAQLPCVEPGFYTLVLRGFTAGQVDHFGIAADVAVRRGSTTIAAIPVTVFRPTIDSLTVLSPADSVRVTWRVLTHADRYIAEIDTISSFVTPRTAVIDGSRNSADFEAALGWLHVRVRAANAYVANDEGRASEPDSVLVPGTRH